MQTDLFAPSLVPGLKLVPDLIGEDEERALTGVIDSADLTPFKFQGWLGKRLTASFGWSYDFERGRIAAAEPIPPVLLPLRRKMAAVADLRPEDLQQALLIRYDPGAGIGWHRDRPQFDRVVGLSLGAAAMLRLRHRRTDGRFDRRAVPLQPRAAYLLDGEVRTAWEHSIAPLDQPRWSITFRSLSDLGRRAIG